MIDQTAATLALRNRMLPLVVATTGSVSLSATTTGYARTSGSFLTDGFADGMEISASGFATAGNNGVRIIESVSALAIITSSALAQPVAEVAGAGRTVTAGLPATRAFDNKRLKPVTLRPYIEEDFVPGGHSLVSFPAQGATNDEDGLYVIKWYGLEGKGVPGIRKCVDALKALFAPGTALIASGVTLRVKGAPGEPSVRSSQIIPQDNGWAVCTVTVPWWSLSINTVAP